MEQRRGSEIVSGWPDEAKEGVDDARAYYAKEFLDYRCGQPTPYMDGLRFEPRRDAPDPDTRVLSDGQLAEAEAAGRQAAASR